MTRHTGEVKDKVICYRDEETKSLQLSLLAISEGTSSSELLRRIVDDYLESKRVELGEEGYAEVMRRGIEVQNSERMGKMARDTFVMLEIINKPA